MSETVIRVENLGKKYVIGHQKQERYTALRDVLAEKARSFGQMFSRNGKQDDPTHEEFWVLKDVSFEIKQGDRVGIIGRNGAGKSTLLKILSRITEPTEGRISIKGRVASLLEVGTGFHPELTGRENIFLNGAILGMTKAEIKKKFDEIVAFAEVEKFLDTPVKRYSSGMYVRLAFAVAAHLEPEILIVDEVLAVGDAQFQKKCLGKMEDVATKEERTVLFVSHNLEAIRSLCNQSLLLESGSLSFAGHPDKTIRKYIANTNNLDSSRISFKNTKDSPKPYIQEAHLVPHENPDLFWINREIIIVIKIETQSKDYLEIGLFIKEKTTDLCVHHTSDIFVDADFINSDEYHASSVRTCYVPPYALAAGEYYIDLYLMKRNHEFFDKVLHALNFEVLFTGKLSDKTKSTDWKGLCGPGLLIWK
ncbi:MAG: polysaccharide ABC transporter ATP-binding protein [Snowella sp.]|nr:polysaccharide ABC transporter ATP-binding protein [Snowella sp.]